MTWVLLGLAAIASVVGGVALIGWLLPVEHTATRRRRFAVSPEVLWQMIVHAEAFPAWRSTVRRVERLSDGRDGWIEEGENGPITLVVQRAEAPRLLALKIADGTLPFGGTWTYTLEPADGGTDLTITEDGEVYNPIFRFASRYMFGHDATIAAYFADLEKKLASGTSRT